MKKIAVSLLSALLFLGLFTNAGYAAASSFRVYVNGTKVNFQVDPIVQNGTTMVQIAPILKNMDSQYRWYQSTKELIIIRGDSMIEMQLNSKIVYVNGAKKRLSVAPSAYAGYTMVPLRFIGEAFGGNVTLSNGAINISISAPVSELDLSINDLPSDQPVSSTTPVSSVSNAANIEDYVLKSYSNYLNNSYGGFVYKPSFIVKESINKDGYTVALYFENFEDSLRLLEVLEDDLRMPRKFSRLIADGLHDQFGVTKVMVFLGTTFRGDYETITASTVDYIEGVHVNFFIGEDEEFHDLP